ncbi:MAG: hypothetical protein CMJ78_11325 [Planctomycetaceae bacterium]|nr:hypothetical protein [Planctomycetaceae bacterium]
MKFVTPLEGVPFKTWRITNYVDIDPRTDSVRDHHDGEFSYDIEHFDHDGIDIGPGHFRASDAGIAIVAAADGVVTSVTEGHFDRHKGPFSFEAPPSNTVIVDHGNGWRTLYIHNRRDSIEVQEGETVVAGQHLALMGSSGNSSGLIFT